MSICYGGIDPAHGENITASIYYPDERILLILPSLKNLTDSECMEKILDFFTDHCPLLTVIEKVNLSHAQGAKGYEFARWSGILEGLLQAEELMYLKFSPEYWRKLSETKRVVKGDKTYSQHRTALKKASLKRARKLFGKDYFPLEKNHNEAESSLMAYSAYIYSMSCVENE